VGSEGIGGENRKPKTENRKGFTYTSLGIFTDGIADEEKNREEREHRFYWRGTEQ
jgi:hypothetical protein